MAAKKGTLESLCFEDGGDRGRKPKVTEEPLWLDVWHNTDSINQQLRRTGLKWMKDVTNEEQLHPLQSNDVVGFLKSCAVQKDLYLRSNEVVGVLKACTKQKDLDTRSKVHAFIVERKLLEKNCYIASGLINMYARCGALAKAQQVLDELPARDMVMWTALIRGYSEQEQREEALRCFDTMQCEGYSPDAISLLCALKACGSIGAATRVEQIHDRIVSLGMLEKDILLASTLVETYARCGALAKAQQVFSKLPSQDVITWTLLISGYAQQGQGGEALKYFDSMQDEGHMPDVVTFVCALKACGSIGAAAKGEKIHGKIVALGILQKDIVLGSALVDMYARCGAVLKAQQVLDELPVRNVVSWNGLIAGCVEQEQGKKALECFDIMQCEGHLPDAVTFICVVKACGSLGAVTKGEDIHEKIGSLGMLEKDIILGSALVDMYARCGALVRAQKVLYELHRSNVVSWNALIAGYVQQGQGEEALKCFHSMQAKGHSPNAVTFTCALRACGSAGAVAQGEEIHNKIVTLGLLRKDVVLGSVLVDMYARCGALAKAQQVFNDLPVQSVDSWNALIAGYAQQEQSEEALKCFESMLCDGSSPDAITYTCVLKACGSMGAAATGGRIHDIIVCLGLLEKDIVLGSALVDMYTKCALFAKAAQVLNEITLWNVIMWNAILAGYAQEGQCREAVNCLGEMQSKGVLPDQTTLVRLLKSCNHAGLLDEAKLYFSIMSTKYCLAPDIEHFCCMVDLFGRAGKFIEALTMMEKMAFADNLSLWLSLLGACHKWGDVKIGELAFECVLSLHSHINWAYVCMANIYAAAGRQEDADRIEVMG